MKKIALLLFSTLYVLHLSATIQTITFSTISDKYINAGTFTVTATSTAGVLATINYTSSNPSIATVGLTSGIVTIIGTSAGSVTITANSAAVSSFDAAAPVSRSFTVLKNINTVTFSPIANQLATTATITPTAATCLGSTAITYASSNPTVASVNATTGVISINTSGTVTISATAASNATYDSRTNSQTFTITKALNTMTFASITDKLLSLGSFTPTAASCLGATPITYSSTNTSVATVNATSGLVTFVAEGSVSIKASTVGSARYAASAVTRNFSVLKTPNTMTFAAIPNQLMITGTFTPTAATNTGATPITYSSNKTSVATVNSTTGLVTLVAPGTVTITASTVGSATIASCSASRSFSVSTSANTMTFPVITDRALSLGTFTPTLASCLGLTPITYSSSNTGVATVNSTTGVVTLVAAGSVTITASTVGSTTFSASSLGRTFNVTKTANTMTFAAIANQLMSVGSFTPTAATNTGATPITYSSSNLNVATVNATTGLITLVAPGPVTITASTVGSATIAACSASRTFTAYKASNTMTFNAIPNQLVTVGTFTPTVATNTGGTPITYSSSNTAVATVNSSTGAITVLTAGITNITANTVGSATIASCFKKQALTVTLVPNIITFPAIANQLMTTGTVAASATATSGTVVYSSLNTSVATVNSSTGVITFVGAGTASIAASVAASGNYALGSAVRTFNITKVAQTISWTAIPTQAISVFGTTPITVAATASSALAVTYSVVSGPATVAGNTVTSTGVSGTVVLRATQAGNTSYIAKTQDIAFIVTSMVIPIASQSNRNMLLEKPATSTIYPNPTTGVIFINSDASIKSISVYDIIGNILVSEVFENNATNSKIDLTTFPKGIYFVKLKSENSALTEKIILQ